MAYPSPRRLQLRRGNAVAVASYLGYAGELVVDTSNWTLYVHDGVTVGGYAATVNTAVITAQITSVNANIIIANVGMKGYVDQGNSIQAASITSSNIGMRGYVDATIRANIANIAVASTYSNVNVRTYLGSFDGNIIPSANVTYSLGSITRQWKDLFVSNNTIYVGGVPLTIDNTGNLTVNGNVIPTISYVNTVVANVTVDLSSYALNANVTAANVGLKGYVDQANTIQSAQVNAANLAITAANVGMRGYVDQANTIQSAQVNAANLAITAANVGMKGYVDASIGNIAPAYSNANVASYLPIYSGNIGANISKAGYTWTFGTDGTLTLPGPNPGIYASDNSTIYTDYLATTTLSTAQINGTNAGNHLIIQTNNLWSWQFNSDGSTAFPGNVTIEGNLFVNGNVNYISVNNLAIGDNIINLADLNPADSLDLGLTAHRTVNSLLQHTGLIRDASANQWRLFSNVVQNPGTTVDFTDAIYDDLQLGNIISPTITAINNNIAAANAAIAFANTIQSQQLAAANVGIIGYIDRANTIQSAQITAANVGIIGYIDQGNTIQAAAITTANVGMKGYVDFANTIMKAYVDGQIIAANANVSSSYSNVQVATYLPTYSGNIANIRLGVSGILTFADGTTQTTAATGGGSNYGNGNVASYLITNGYVNTNSAYANANVTSYLPTHTGNVGVNYLLGTTPNVTVTAGTFNSVFDTTGNVVLPTAYVAGNVTANYFIGNGALLTGIVASGGGGTNYSNVNVKAYTETMGFQNYGNVNVAAFTSGLTNYSNVNVAAYLNATGYNLYSNANVASYLPTYSGNVRALNFIGAIQAQVGSSFAYAQDAFGATSDTGSVFLPADANSNAIVAGYTIVGNSGAVTLTVTSASFVAGSPNFVQVNTSPSPVVFTYPVTVYTANYSPALPLSTITVGNATVSGNVSAQYLFGNGAFLTGIVVSSGGTNYSNVNVKAYTETMGFQNYGNVNVAALITTNGLTNYSNVNTAAYLNSQGYNLYSNVNVAAYLSTATINTTGNITAAYLTGNINITGNVTGTSPNVTIQAGSFSSVFDNQGNVSVPRLFTAGNIQTAGYLFGNGAFLTGIVAGSSYSNVQVATYLPTYTGVITASNVAVNGNVTAQFLFGNGSQLTGLPSSYSNVNVATYLPTYSGNIANIRLGVSGVLTFADGTTQVTAGGGSYSNVQVGAYLTTGISTAAPQIQLTNATSNYIRYSNVGVGIPTFTTSSVGTRVIYWPSVDATTADYAVGIDAGVLWHGIPRATSGFAFKWYAGNTQIAMMEGTGLFTVANIRLSPSGNITFSDGTILNSAATIGGNYSNVNVAVYLPTYGGTIQSSNVQTTTANIQATTAATNPATGALRVMGGVGVAGAVVAGQLNTTGNLIANAISAYSLNTVANVVASVVNAGTINSSGNVLAQNLIGTIATASQPSITAVGTLATLAVTGNATVGNLIGTEANTRIIANVYTTTFDIYGNVTFPGNIITPTGLYVGPTLFTALPNTVAQFTSNANSYVQINFENLSSGTDATSDYIATANNGTDTTFFVDLGIANSNYDNLSPNNSLGTAVFANDSYLYAQGNLATTTGGNLVIGTSTANKSVKIFAGGINSANIVATVSNTGMAVTGNVSTTGYIVTTGGFGNITQVDYITANNVVATANVTVQGMGVTMPNRPAFRVNGTALYGGAQSTANVNLRGVAVSTQYNQGSYFDATTGKFTAPIAGIYEILLNARVNSSFNGLAQLVVLKNGLNTAGNIVAFWETTSNIAAATHFGVSGTVVLATGDYLSANILAGNVTFDQNDNWSVTYLG